MLLGLTAIVLVPGGTYEHSAAVINDRVFREGDEPLDADGVPLEGVVVLKIDRGSVRFRYKDTEFVRDLED